MNSKKSMTSGMQFIGVMWNHMRRDSWEGKNHAMWSAFTIAVGSGLEFSAEDFKTGFGDFGKGWSCGCDFDTVLYQIAVQSDNITVCRSMEEAYCIGPYFANGVDLGWKHNAVMLHMIGDRARSRLCVGCIVHMDGNMWHVTSMDKDVCRFAMYRGGGHKKGSPVGLRKLTREQLAEIFPAPKKAKKKVESE